MADVGAGIREQPPSRAVLAPRWPIAIAPKYLLSVFIGAVGLTLLTLPVDGSLPVAAVRGGGVLVLFLGLWLTNVLSDHLAAILFFCGVSVLGIAPPEIVFSGFMSSAVWLILGGLILCATVEGTGLATRFSRSIVARFGGNYATVVTGCVAVGTVLVFVLPSSIGRVVLLMPVIVALADRIGFPAGSNGRAGLVLGAMIGTLIPSYAVLPSAAPNLAMIGTAEKLYGVTFTYTEYLLVNFPVMATLTIVALPLLICRLLPDRTRAELAPEPRSPLSIDEIRLIGVLIAAMGLWLTDWLHGVSPAWVALGAAAACLAPGIGPGRSVSLSNGVNLGIWLFIAAAIGLGAMISHTGLGELVARALVGQLGLEPGEHARNYFSLAGIGMAMTALATNLGAPVIMTTLAETFAQATGWPLETVLMLQIPGWIFFPFPYELPALVVALTLGAVKTGQCVRLLLALALFGLVVVLPLQFFWLRALGYVH